MNFFFPKKIKLTMPWPIYLLCGMIKTGNQSNASHESWKQNCGGHFSQLRDWEGGFHASWSWSLLHKATHYGQDRSAAGGATKELNIIKETTPYHPRSHRSMNFMASWFSRPYIWVNVWVSCFADDFYLVFVVFVQVRASWSYLV